MRSLKRFSVSVFLLVISFVLISVLIFLTERAGIVEYNNPSIFSYLVGFGILASGFGFYKFSRDYLLGSGSNYVDASQPEGHKHHPLE